MKLNEVHHRIYVKAENAALELNVSTSCYADSVNKMFRVYDIKDSIG